MVLQTFNLLENIYFHIIIAPVTLLGIFFILKHLFKMKWNSIELKVTLLIILTTLILTELIVLILLVFRDNLLYYLLSFMIGFSLFIYLLYFTIKSIIAYSNNLILAMDEIERSQQQYRTAYKNAELYKDVFAHDISNMLQNLTISIDLYDYLSNKHNEIKNIDTIINSFKSQIEHGTELVANIRLLSKLDIEDSIIKTIDLTSKIEEVINEVKQKYLETEIKLESDIENQKPYVRTDDNLYYLFKNLILNGIIHNDNPQKEILIKIRNTDKKFNNHFKIEIIDNGRGLDPHLKDNYAKFINGTEIEFRTGLGLMVVRRLISIYNGFIFIEDRIEGDYTKGTKVIVYLLKE
ncbi:MAG: sensor histidine kinase [Candidatus Hermodarchaeota archaeon]